MTIEPPAVASEARRAENLRRWLLFAVMLIPMLALSLWYVQRTYVDVVWQDAFIHVPMIADFLEGRGSLPDLLGSFFGGHLLLGYRILLLLNAKLFSLDMRLDPVLFVVSSATMATIIYAEFTSQFSGLRASLTALLSLPLVLLCFSLVAPPGALMTTQFVWGTTVALVIAWLLQRDIRRHGPREQWLTANTAEAMALTVVYFVALGGAYFPGLLAGIAALALAHRLCSRRRLERRYWVVAAAMLASAAVYSWFASQNPGQAAAGSRFLIFTDAGGTILSYVTGIGASLVDPHTLEGRSQNIWLVLGFLLLALAVCAVALFIRLRLWEQSYLPIYCLAYPLGVITMIRFDRASFGWEWIGSEWYTFHYRLFAVGVVWIFISAAVVVVRRGWRPSRSWRTKGTLVMVLVVVTAATVGCSHLLANGKQWRRGPYVRYWLEAKRNALLFPEYYDDPAEVLLVSGEALDASRETLQKHGLSSFSPRSMAALNGTMVPFDGWSGDGWIGERGSGAVIAQTDGSVTLTAQVPDFLPSNQIEVRVNGATVFAGDIAAGDLRTFTAPVKPGLNEIDVVTERTASPLDLGIGQDQRELGVLMTVSLESADHTP